MKKHFLYAVCAIALVLGTALVAFPVAVQEISGLAVAASSTTWNSLKDAGVVGDNQTSGLSANGPYLFNGVGWDKWRGTTGFGALVDVSRIQGGDVTPADGTTNPTDAITVFSLGGIFNGTTWDRWRGNVSPAQQTTVLNVSQNSAANTANVVTLTGAAGTRVHLYKITRASCAPAGTADILVTDGGTGIWGTFANQVPQNPMYFEETWPVALTGTTAQTMVITLSACGSGNIGTLTVQADRY